MDSLNVLAGSIGHGTGSSQRNMKMSMKVKSEKQEFTFGRSMVSAALEQGLHD